MSARRGDWMQTHSGGRWWPLDPRPGDFRIRDIAHSLALKNRFGGHSRFPISVAIHSVNVSHNVHPAWRREALMHDAPEAVVGDMVRPMKHQPEMAGFREAEEANWSAIATQFGLLGHIPKEVHRADNAVLVAEAAAALNPPTEGRTPWWTEAHWPTPAELAYPFDYEWHEAEAIFLNRFVELFPEHPF